MRPVTRQHSRSRGSHRPQRHARTAQWRTSAPERGDYTTDRDLRPALFICLLLATGYGRGLRMVAGGLLISLGASAGGGPLTTTLASLGLIATLEAMFDLCLVAPVLGCPVDGSAIRGQAAALL